MSLVVIVRKESAIFVNFVSITASAGTSAGVKVYILGSGGGFSEEVNRQSLLLTPVNGIFIGTAGFLM